MCVRQEAPLIEVNWRHALQIDLPTYLLTYLHTEMFVQAMNILIVNQSVIDMCASFFTLLTAVVEVDGTRMSPDSVYDQFVCRIWLTRIPLWDFLITSTYGIFLMALERYISVVYPFWCKSNVKRTSCFIPVVECVNQQTYFAFHVNVFAESRRKSGWPPFRTAAIFPQYFDDFLLIVVIIIIIIIPFV